MTEHRLRPIPSSQDVPPGIDISVASPARIYDYWLGGKDNFPADQEAAEQVITVFPGIIPGVRANRAFLGRAVRYLAGEAGVRQFLDIGTGLPTENNAHEVAQAVAPDSRIVYVDNDPIVLVHARALLTSTPQGATTYIEADVRDPDRILREAAQTLDFSKPVAITLLMILMLVQDSEDPYGIIKRLMDAVPSGSYLAISHPAGDVDSGEIAEAYERLNERMGATQGTLRNHRGSPASSTAWRWWSRDWCSCTAGGPSQVRPAWSSTCPPTPGSAASLRTVLQSLRTAGAW